MNETSNTRPAKVLTLTPRQRILLHKVLHQDLRKCSSNALGTFQRFGWTTGANEGYQLTDIGRRVAELSELSPPDRELVIDLP